MKNMLSTGIEKEYQISKYHFNKGDVTIYEPCLSQEDKDKRQKIFEQASIRFMKAVIKDQIKKEQKSL